VKVIVIERILDMDYQKIACSRSYEHAQKYNFCTLDNWEKLGNDGKYKISIFALCQFAHFSDDSKKLWKTNSVSKIT